MIIPLSNQRASSHLRLRESNPAHAARGSALLIVLILLSIVATLIVSNGVVLGRLKAELQLLEKRQIRRLAEPLPATAALVSPRGEDRAGGGDPHQRGQSEPSPRPIDQSSPD